MDSTNILTGTLHPDRTITELHLADGRILRIDTALLLPSAPISPAPLPTGTLEDAVLIPLVEERLTLGKQTIETAKIRLHKTIQPFTETLNEPLAVRTYDIERIVLNHPVDAAPAVRQEGETTIYPLVEEQLILTKQLILKEEVRITRRDTERRDTRTVTLTREHITVERESL